MLKRSLFLGMIFFVVFILLSFFVFLSSLERNVFVMKIGSYITSFYDDTHIKDTFDDAIWTDIDSGTRYLSGKKLILSTSPSLTSLQLYTSGCVDLTYVVKQNGFQRAYTLADKLFSDQKRLGIRYDSSLFYLVGKKIINFIKLPLKSYTTYSYFPLLSFSENDASYKKDNISIVKNIVFSDLSLDIGYDQKFLTTLFYQQYGDSLYAINKTLYPIHICSFSGFILPLNGGDFSLPFSNSYFLISSSGADIIFTGSNLSQISENDKMRLVNSLLLSGK